MDDFTGKIPERRPGSRPGRTSSAAALGPQDRMDPQIQAFPPDAFAPLADDGDPLEGLTPAVGHDPDWWVRRMIKREKITGALPPAITLRIEDARLEEALDRESSEAGVREIIEEFNRRVVEARRQLLGGPPVITPTRDADREVELWEERRALRQRGA